MTRNAMIDEAVGRETALISDARQYLRNMNSLRGFRVWPIELQRIRAYFRYLAAGNIDDSIGAIFAVA